MSNLADQFKRLSINNSNESQLFVKISKNNSLFKIDALTNIKNF